MCFVQISGFIRVSFFSFLFWGYPLSTSTNNKQNTTNNNKIILDFGATIAQYAIVTFQNNGTVCREKDLFLQVCRSVSSPTLEVYRLVIAALHSNFLQQQNRVLTAGRFAAWLKSVHSWTGAAPFRTIHFTTGGKKVSISSKTDSSRNYSPLWNTTDAEITAPRCF